MKKYIPSCMLLIFLLIGAMGCSETTTVPVENDPPTVAFTFDPIAVARGANVTLTVTATDPDEDPLTITWDVTRGTLNSAYQGKPTMPWRAPSQAGTDTVTVTVTDGQNTVSIADTIVVGYIWTSVVSGQVTWDVSESPVVISSSTSPPRLVVEAHASLTIQPDVVVYVQEGSIFDVAGTLHSSGTADHLVKFFANSRDPEPGFWEGMLGSTDAGSGAPPGSFDLKYTRITYAAQNLLLTNGSSANLQNCQLYFSRDAALHHDSGSGSLVVNNCQITDNNGNGVEISAISTRPAFVNITHSKISFNGGMGISIGLNDPNGDTPITISENEITWNSFYGIQLYDAVYPTVNFNSIYNNDRLKSNAANRQNFRLEPGWSGNLPEIDATNNYWLTTDSLVIEQTVYDSKDNMEISARVKFWPWLNAAP